MAESKSPPPASHYNANYGNFQTELYAQIRHEAFGEDIGQNSWLTSDEQDIFLEWLDLTPEKILLDVACGAGGPALRIAANTGCSVVGLDVHEQAVTTASLLAAQRGLAARAEFRSIDATPPLPFANASFDAITCIDAINHFSDRPRIIAEWARGLCLRTTSCPKTPVLAQKPQGYWFIVKKKIIESEIAARLTADHPSLDRYTDKYLLCGSHRCAGSVPHRNPWREIYRSRSSQKPVSGQFPIRRQSTK